MGFNKQEDKDDYEKTAKALKAGLVIQLQRKNNNTILWLWRQADNGPDKFAFGFVSSFIVITFAF